VTSLTDYQVLSGSPIEIDSKSGAGSPDSQQLTFNLPADFTVGLNRARPLLAFIVRFLSDDGSCGIWVNPQFPLKQTTRVHTLTWKGSNHFDAGLWEAIDGTIFNAGKENRVIFAMQEGDKGIVRFRDIVLWYQRGATG